MSRSWKTLAVPVATTITALVLASTALGAFDARQGPLRWATSLGSSISGVLAPGVAESLPFTVANAGESSQRLSSVTVSLPTEPNGDAETAAGADIPGCLAAWFTVTVDGGASLPSALAPGATYQGAVVLTMGDSGTNQGACQGAAPAITVTAS